MSDDELRSAERAWRASRDPEDARRVFRALARRGVPAGAPSEEGDGGALLAFARGWARGDSLECRRALEALAPTSRPDPGLPPDWIPSGPRPAPAVPPAALAWLEGWARALEPVEGLWLALVSILAVPGAVEGERVNAFAAALQRRGDGRDPGALDREFRARHAGVVETVMVTTCFRAGLLRDDGPPIVRTPVTRFVHPALEAGLAAALRADDGRASPRAEALRSILELPSGHEPSRPWFEIAPPCDAFPRDWTGQRFARTLVERSLVANRALTSALAAVADEPTLLEIPELAIAVGVLLAAPAAKGETLSRLGPALTRLPEALQRSLCAVALYPSSAQLPFLEQLVGDLDGVAPGARETAERVFGELVPLYGAASILIPPIRRGLETRSFASRFLEEHHVRILECLAGSPCEADRVRVADIFGDRPNPWPALESVRARLSRDGSPFVHGALETGRTDLQDGSRAPGPAS